LWFAQVSIYYYTIYVSLTPPSMLNIQNKNGFTLVELIVTITILAILGTIAFLSFQWYSKSARDSVRINDINNIKMALELFVLKTGKYPEPSSSQDVTFSWGTVRNQGTVWDSVITNLSKINKLPVDPLTGSEYSYSRLNTKKEFEVWAILENNLIGQTNVIHTANAALENVVAYITGPYNGALAQVTVVWTTYLLAVPTIISTDLSSLNILDIISNNRLAYTNTPNIPASYKWDYTREGWFVFNDIQTENIVVFSWSVTDLNDSAAQAIFIENLQTAYSGTTLAKDWIYASILSVDSDETWEVYALVWPLVEDTVWIKLVNNTPVIEWVCGTSNGLPTSSIPPNQCTTWAITSFIDNGEWSTYTWDCKWSWGWGTQSCTAEHRQNLLLSKINNSWWSGLNFFTSIVFDGTNYLAVWYSDSNLSAFPWGETNLWSYDFLVAKFDTNLNLITLKSFWWTWVDILNSVIYDGTNYVVVWQSSSNLSAIWWTATSWWYEAVIAKIDSNLNIITLNNIWWWWGDYLYSVATDGINYVAVWKTTSNLTSIWWSTLTSTTDNLVIRFDNNLVKTHVKNEGGSYTAKLNDIIYDGSRYIAVWEKWIWISGLVNTGFDIVILWEDDLVYTDSYSAAVYNETQRLNGIVYNGTSYVVVWNSDIPAYNGQADWIIMKFNSNFALLQSKNYWWTGLDSFESVVYDGNDYVIAWYTESNLSSYAWWSTNAWSYDGMVAKFDNNLDLVIMKNYWWTNQERYFDIIFDGANYIPVGYNYSNLSSFPWWSNSSSTSEWLIGKHY